MQLGRSARGLRRGLEGNIPDAEVEATSTGPTVAEQISIERLKFLPRLVAHAPPILCAMLATDDAEDPTAWKGALAADYRWMAAQLGWPAPATAEAALAEAERHASESPKQWRKSVNTAAATAAERRAASPAAAGPADASGPADPPQPPAAADGVFIDDDFGLSLQQESENIRQQQEEGY